MSNVRISQLPAASALAGTELFEVTQASSSRSTTALQLKTYMEGAVSTLGTLSVTGALTLSNRITLASGTTTLPPLVLQAGTNLTSALAGAVEWNGTNLFITQTTGPTRKTVAYTDSNITGNANTATALATARTINGVSFDGSANITVPAAAGTLTGSTLAAGVTASSLTSVGTLTSLTVSGSITAGQLSGSTALLLTATGNNNLQLWTNGSARLVLGGSGNITAQTPLLFSADNTHDIGAVGATRPRTIYAGTSVVAPTFTEGTSAVVVATDIGTGANEIPLNQMLGTLAFQDALYPTVGQLQRQYTVLADNTVAQGLDVAFATQVGISADTTLTTTVAAAGTEACVVVVAVGTTSRTVTFGTGFAASGTLTTGTDAGRRFIIRFISDGTRFLEVSRTTALTV